MMKFRKIISVVFAFAVVGLSCAACSSSDTASTAGAASRGKAPKVTWYAAYANPDSIDRINVAANKMLKAAGINVNFQLIWTSSDYETKISSMIAAHEDFSMFNQNMAFIDNYAMSNGVHEITDSELSTYLPDVVSSMGENCVNNARYNGKLYAVPVVHEYGQWFGLEYNSDIATKYNIDMSKVKSIDDLDPIFEQLHSVAPDIFCTYNGTTEPLYVMANLDFINRSDSLCTAMYLDNDCKQAFNYWESDKTKAALKKIHEWYKKGYLETDTTADMSSLLNKEGKIFSYIQRSKVGNTEQMSTQGQHFKQIVFNEFNGGKPISTFLDYPGGWAVGISSSCSNPTAAMQVLNFAFKNADFINLLNYGEKDVDYTLDSNNVATIKDSGYAFDCYNCASWQMGNQYLIYVSKQNVDAGLPDIWTKLKNFNNSAKALDHTGFYFSTSEFSTEISSIATTFKEYSPGLLWGSVDDIDGTLSEFNKALKDNGIQRVLDGINSQYSTFLASKKK